MNLEERIRADGFEGLEPVLFYLASHENGEGSNFSAHEIWLPHPFTGRIALYKTGEHRYQAMKADNPEPHEAIRRRPTAFAAKVAGGPRSKIPNMRLREGWGDDYGDLCWYVMSELVLAKTLQHRDIYLWLKGTGLRPIYEDSPTDDIWGVRYRLDYRGKNLLGRCWMYVRKIVFFP